MFKHNLGALVCHEDEPRKKLIVVGRVYRDGNIECNPKITYVCEGEEDRFTNDYDSSVLQPYIELEYKYDIDDIILFHRSLGKIAKARVVKILPPLNEGEEYEYRVLTSDGYTSLSESHMFRNIDELTESLMQNIME